MRSTLCDFESMACDARGLVSGYRFEVQKRNSRGAALARGQSEGLPGCTRDIGCNRRWDWLRSFMLLLPWRKSGKKSETRTPSKRSTIMGLPPLPPPTPSYDYGSFQTKDSHSSSDDEDATPCSSIQRAS